MKMTKAKLLILCMVLFICLCVVCVALFVLYQAIFHPLVTTFFTGPKAYKGVDVFTSKEYQKYYKAEVFDVAISSLPFLDTTQIDQFWYFDNFTKDNIFYGRYTDAYVLEVSLGDNYDAAYNYASQFGEFSGEMDSYDLYWLKDAHNSEDDFFLIAISDEGKLRCILLTDYSNSDVSAISADSVLLNTFYINWE